MKKVYCKNCKYCGLIYCRKLGYAYPQAGGYNTLYDCNKYKRKWYKFWIKNYEELYPLSQIENMP